MGHEHCGIVEEVGKEVRTIKPGQFVVGSFATSDNTCLICRDGYQSSCWQREFMNSAQAPVLRVPLADGTWVSTLGVPSKELMASLLETSDVLGTGWFAAKAANESQGRPLQSSETARSGCWLCFQPSRWVQKGSSPRVDTTRGRNWRESLERLTS